MSRTPLPTIEQALERIVDDLDEIEQHLKVISNAMIAIAGWVEQGAANTGSVATAIDRADQNSRRYGQ